MALDVVDAPHLVTVGRRTITLRRKGKRIIDQRTEEIVMSRDYLKKLVGDGRAQVKRGVHLRESGEVNRSTWLTAEVVAEVVLTCDQSAEGIEEADEAAWAAVTEMAEKGMVWGHQWIEDVGSGEIEEDEPPKKRKKKRRPE